MAVHTLYRVPNQEEPESDEEHSPWRSLSSTASSGGKKKVNEDDKKLPKVNFAR